MSEPTWDPDAHLERVYRRGRFLRRRRRVGALVGGLAAIALAAVVTANLSGGPDRGRRVATAGTGVVASATTTTTGVGAITPGPGSEPGPVDTTTSTPGGGRAGAASTTSTRPARPVTTTRPTTPPTTAAPATTTTTSAAPADCAPSDLAYKTSTDATSYPASASVSIDLVATNISNHTCLAPNNSGLSAAATVTDSAGHTVFQSTPFGVACTLTCPHPLLAPGQSTSYGAGTWDNATSGRNYHAVASRNGAVGSPATFSVT